MVRYQLLFKAQLENIAEIETGEGDLFGVSVLQMLCNKCGHLVNKKIKAISQSSWPNIHRPPINSLKCNSCGTLDKIKVTRIATNLSAEVIEGGSAVVAEVECTKYTPSACVIGQGWKAISSAGTVFKAIDLSMDFFDYDPSGQCEVAIKQPSVYFQEMESSSHGWN